MTMSVSMQNTGPDRQPGEALHVAVAAIVSSQGQVLISQRPGHVHQGGLWEFPGGKLESGESVQDALQREIHEELGISIVNQRPLIRIPYRYPDRSVLLDVWKIDAFHGEPHGKEGQPIEWVAIDSLCDEHFPAANRSIIRALQLPSKYLITPEPTPPAEGFVEHLQACLDKGIRLVQLRAKKLDKDDYCVLARRVIGLCHEYGAKILLNTDAGLVQTLGADGVHLTSQRLQHTRERPLPQAYLVAASCHTLEELRVAQQAGADFAMLSPVLPTASHPDASPLGWPAFSQSVDLITIPVYALGGMAPAHCDTALAHGAQGIAAIRALWDDV
ncbi:MAG: Nudix family hydrolase [Gammaproteobacteria bacterium]|nr:MAG: Nudix family hydrolase [Gammaproteobacteria bacterium]